MACPIRNPETTLGAYSTEHLMQGAGDNRLRAKQGRGVTQRLASAGNHPHVLDVEKSGPRGQGYHQESDGALTRPRTAAASASPSSSLLQRSAEQKAGNGAEGRQAQDQHEGETAA